MFPSSAVLFICGSFLNFSGLLKIFLRRLGFLAFCNAGSSIADASEEFCAVELTYGETSFAGVDGVVVGVFAKVVVGSAVVGSLGVVVSLEVVVSVGVVGSLEVIAGSLKAILVSLEVVVSVGVVGSVKAILGSVGVILVSVSG
ncbi:hypothetical protein NEAUS06_2483, partial [Nematocida ausubeli]